MTERELVDDTIRRAAVVTTNALIEIIRAGFPRHVYMTWDDVQEVERTIVDVLTKRSLE